MKDDDIYQGLDTDKLSEIDDEVNALIDQLRIHPEVTTTASETERVGSLAHLLTSYLSHHASFISINLQKKVTKQTESLVRWTRILAVSTVFLALATFALVLLTYLRPASG